MLSLPRVGLLLSAFCICASILHAAPALVTTNADTPMVRFAAGEVRAALAERGEAARVFIGTHASFPGGAAKEPPAVAEAYTIGRPGGTIVVAGHDETGAMYGALEVAELIRIGGAAAVKEASAKPFLEVRQFKYNIPSVRDQAWFHDPAYWQSLFGLLARARMNSVGFWHQHPFPYMVRLERFPEAAVLKPEEIERNIKTWRMILRLGRLDLPHQLEHPPADRLCDEAWPEARWRGCARRPPVHAGLRGRDAADLSRPHRHRSLRGRAHAQR